MKKVTSKSDEESNSSPARRSWGHVGCSQAGKTTGAEVISDNVSNDHNEPESIGGHNRDASNVDDANSSEGSEEELPDPIELALTSTLEGTNEEMLDILVTRHDPHKDRLDELQSSLRVLPPPSRSIKFRTRTEIVSFVSLRPINADKEHLDPVTFRKLEEAQALFCRSREEQGGTSPTRLSVFLMSESKVEVDVLVGLV